jgi:hypothetical protein
MANAKENALIDSLVNVAANLEKAARAYREAATSHDALIREALTLEGDGWARLAQAASAECERGL